MITFRDGHFTFVSLLRLKSHLVEAHALSNKAEGGLARGEFSRRLHKTMMMGFLVCPVWKCKRQFFRNSLQLKEHFGDHHTRTKDGIGQQIERVRRTSCPDCDFTCDFTGVNADEVMKHCIKKHPDWQDSVLGSFVNISKVRLFLLNSID